MNSKSESELIPLSRIAGRYVINAKKPFVGEIVLEKNEVREILRFAWDMSWGNAGDHRPNRSGGHQKRDKSIVFQDVFEGKCGEFAVKKKFNSLGIQTSEVDLRTFDRGVWDDTDLLALGKSINVKTAKHFSNLLLLEYEDYKCRGDYLGETNSNKSYDLFVFTRLKSELHDFIKDNGLKKKEFSKKEDFFPYAREILQMEWWLDLPGFITKKRIKEALELGHIIKQGDLLNYTKMDASNIYVQSGCLISMGEIMEFLKSA